MHGMQPRDVVFVVFPGLQGLDLVGPAHAADLLLTGRKVAAAEALALGLVNRVVPASGMSSK